MFKTFAMTNNPSWQLFEKLVFDRETGLIDYLFQP